MDERDDPEVPRFQAIEGRAGDVIQEISGPGGLPEGANDEAILLKIEELEALHRDLDAEIRTVEERMPYDRLTIQRLKKKKLVLKDEITKLHGKILPDIIA